MFYILYVHIYIHIYIYIYTTPHPKIVTVSSLVRRPPWTAARVPPFPSTGWKAQGTSPGWCSAAPARRKKNYGKMARIAGFFEVGLINLFEEMVLWCFMYIRVYTFTVIMNRFTDILGRANWSVGALERYFWPIPKIAQDSLWIWELTSEIAPQEAQDRKMLDLFILGSQS